MAQLPEGRKPLTDGDMVILLHNMARDAENAKNKYLGSELRETADRFSELAKAAGISQHKAQQG